MPKKLNISSNERIDIDDFNRASSDYTQESDNFERQKLVQTRRSLVASGFRIEISNQATSPGQFTIYNGAALDRSGNILNNEQQINDARTLTLTGTGTSFYVEIEFVEGESDVNSRAFWDPTFSPANPPGKEFSLSVATRIAPDWQVVSPVSTTGFDVDADVNSVKIPIAILYTNVSNEIEGFTAVNISSVMEEDIPAAPSTLELKVLDSTLFPSSAATASLGFGTANVETVTITANDRANGIITISPGTIKDHNAGAILKVDGAPTYLPQDTDAVPAAPAATTSADQRRGLFAGDELRGSALSASAQDADARSDLAVQSLKDHIDFLAAQIRELKFGNLRSDIDGGLPPSSFSSTRHYDAAGSVTGARTRTITIGDGVISFGDLNTTVDDLSTVLQAAHDALNATNGGSVFVKTGNYTWNTTTIATDRPIEIVFEIGALISSPPGNFSILVTTADPIVIKNFPSPPSGDPCILQGTSSRDIKLENCHFRLHIVGGATREFYARSCTFSESSDPACLISDTFGYESNYTFDDCTFSNDSATSSCLRLFNAVNVLFRNCSVFNETGEVVDIDGGGFDPGCDGVVFEDCTFTSGGGSPTNGQQLVAVTGLHTTGQQVKPIVFRNCSAVVGESSVAGSPLHSIFEFGGTQDFGGKIWVEVDGFHIEYEAATMTPRAVLTLWGHEDYNVNLYKNMTVNINGAAASAHSGTGMININSFTRVENFQLLDFANPTVAIDDPVVSVIADNVDIYGMKFRHDGVAGTLGWGYDGIIYIEGQFVNIHDVYFENTLNMRSTASINSGTFIQTLGAAFPTYGPIMIDGVFMPVGELWCPTNENAVIIGLHSERSTLKRFTGYQTVATGTWDGPWIWINAQFCVVDSAIVQQTVQDGLITFIQLDTGADYCAVTNCLLENNDSGSQFYIVSIPGGANFCRVNNNTANAQTGTASIPDSGTGTVKVGNVLV
jgi:hypothetical protein